MDAVNVIPGGCPDRLYVYGTVPPVAAGSTVLTELPDDHRKPATFGKDSGGGGGGGGTTVAVNETETYRGRESNGRVAPPRSFSLVFVKQRFR